MFRYKYISFAFLLSIGLFLIPFKANAKPYSCTHSASFSTSFQTLFQSNDGVYYGNECSSSPTKYLGFDFNNQPLTANTNYDFTLIYTIFIPSAAETLTTEKTEVFLITDSSSLRLDDFTHVVLSSNTDGNLKAITYRMDFNSTIPVTSDFWIRFTFAPEVGMCITGWNLESLDVSATGNTPLPTPTPTLPPNQDVIDNNNANTDKVINNNNQNTDKIIESNEKTQEVIKDQFQTCRDSYNLFNSEDWYTTLHNINSTSMQKEVVNEIEYYKVAPPGIASVRYMKGQFKENTQYTLTCKVRKYDNVEQTSTGFAFRYTDGTTSIKYIDNTLTEYNYKLVSDKNKTIDSIGLAYSYDNYVLVRDIELDEGSSAKPYEEYGKQVCTNRIDETNKQLEENNKTNQEIKDAITDDSAPDLDSFNDMAGLLPAGPVDSILNLPLTLLNSINKSLGGSCTPVSLPLPYVTTDLKLPCISAIYEQIGILKFFDWVGVVAGGFILYKYLLQLYQWVDDTLTLRENTQQDWGGY